MSDETVTPEPDDTEGHGFSRVLAPQDHDADDTEGQRFGGILVPHDESEEDDVQGHALPAPLVDDTFDHLRR